MGTSQKLLPPEIDQAFRDARLLQANGRVLEAERIYRGLAAPGDYRSFALEALAGLYFEQQRLDEAMLTLRALTEEDPDSLHYCAQLAARLDSVGQTRKAIDEYLRLLNRQPDLAIAHFNLALLQTRIKQYAEALASYQKAIDLDINCVEEVYSNMGVLYSEMQDEAKAAEMYERALQIAPDYVPALFNRAGHREEINEKQQAIDGYEHILTIDPRHWKSLARLAYPRKITSEHQGIVERLMAAIDEPKDDKMAQEGLYFALGKVLDDLGQYEKAADAYVAGNKLGKLRSVPYDKVKTRQAFDQLIKLLDADWVCQNRSESTAAPIFICGMFRSGSTLLEQMLGAHPCVTAGGEIEFLPWLIGSELAPYPEGVRNASREQLLRIGDEYLSRVRELYPDYGNIIDKRPDNYLHIGLIKVLFPVSKIILTRRGFLDNCLSLFFQQLGNNFGYSTDLKDTAHYIQQHQRLMAHWMSFLRDEIFVVDYEELVESPEPLMRRLLSHLGLEWDERVLEFHKVKSLVKTPSLWQVRQKLHSRSRGRWRNYEALVSGLPTLLPPEKT